MSNCVHVVSGAEVRLTAAEIDMVGLKALCDRANETCVAPDWRTDGDAYIAWWFLASNTEFSETDCKIHIGRGRSIHTSRDLKGLFSVLKKFIKRPRAIVLRLTNEYDGHRTSYLYRVNLQTGEEM